MNAGRSGQQLDISVKIRSPSGKLVQYINRKVEDQLLKYSALEDGDYEICFNNRYSMLEVKKVFWQFEVEGAFDEVAAHEKLVNATVEYFQESSKEVETVVRKVLLGSFPFILKISLGTLIQKSGQENSKSWAEKFRDSGVGKSVEAPLTFSSPNDILV